MKASTFLAAALAALVVLAGCQPRLPAAPEETAAPQATSALAMGDVAATVNGQAISMATYQAQVQTAEASYTPLPGSDSGPAESQASLAALRSQVLDWLIDQVLVDQAAARLGIMVTDAEVDAEVQRLRDEKPEGFADWLAANGFTEESFRAQTRSDLLGARVRDAVTRDVAETADQVHLHQIVVGDQATATSVLDRIRQGQATFEDLARAESIDGATRDSGGDIGFMPRGLLPASVEQVAFALQPGQIAGPIQGPFGWHVIKLVERDPAHAVPPDVLATLRQARFMEWLQGERDKATIQRFVKE